MNFIKLIGGLNKGEAVTRAMNRVFTNSFGSRYSWKGKKGKLSFENLKVCEAIIGKHNLHFCKTQNIAQTLKKPTDQTILYQKS